MQHCQKKNHKKVEGCKNSAPTNTAQRESKDNDERALDMKNIKNQKKKKLNYKHLIRSLFSSINTTQEALLDSSKRLHSGNKYERKVAATRLALQISQLKVSQGPASAAQIAEIKGIKKIRGLLVLNSSVYPIGSFLTDDFSPTNFKQVRGEIFYSIHLSQVPGGIVFSFTKKQLKLMIQNFEIERFPDPLASIIFLVDDSNGSNNQGMVDQGSIGGKAKARRSKTFIDSENVLGSQESISRSKQTRKLYRKPTLGPSGPRIYSKSKSMVEPSESEKSGSSASMMEFEDGELSDEAEMLKRSAVLDNVEDVGFIKMKPKKEDSGNLLSDFKNNKRRRRKAETILSNFAQNTDTKLLGTVKTGPSQIRVSSFDPALRRRHRLKGRAQKTMVSGLNSSMQVGSPSRKVRGNWAGLEPPSPNKSRNGAFGGRGGAVRGSPHSNSINFRVRKVNHMGTVFGNKGVKAVLDVDRESDLSEMGLVFERNGRKAQTTMSYGVGGMSLQSENSNFKSLQEEFGEEESFDGGQIHGLNHDLGPKNLKKILPQKIFQEVARSDSRLRGSHKNIKDGTRELESTSIMHRLAPDGFSKKVPSVQVLSPIRPTKAVKRHCRGRNQGHYGAQSHQIGKKMAGRESSKNVRSRLKTTFLRGLSRLISTVLSREARGGFAGASMRAKRGVIY